MKQTTLFEDRSTWAEFSKCGLFRYRLGRKWGDGPAVNFLMLNCSKADETDNDPTVERCERRAVSMGFGQLIVTNLFALRSTDPKQLYRVESPIGPDNDAAILEAAVESQLVVCAWGTHGAYLGRSKFVADLLDAAGIVPHALKISKDGEPCHPLYLPYDLMPQPMKGA